ncbi:DUF6114 domain-containing protein [Streptomyces sp. NPDC059582]|uniref:DUF6114 domain-containing protein n=1 Tax=Streptomyces sp. NPDC059582 TaxID=3346875 RepID=UPI0036AA34A1
MSTRFFAGRPLPHVTVARARDRFRTWRGERPFWAGFFTFTAALPILYWPYANLDLGGVPLALSTTSGAGSLIIGALLMTLGITLWYHPHHRVFAGIVTLLLAVVSLPVANFGGLLLGLISGLIGGSLACAWMPPAAAAATATATATATAEQPTAGAATAATATENHVFTAVPAADDNAGTGDETGGH